MMRMGIKGEVLRKRREELGLTQMQLSERSGVSQGTIDRIENGITLNPTSATERALAKELKTSVEALYGDAEMLSLPKRPVRTETTAEPIEVHPLETALFKAFDTERHTPADFDAARRNVRENFRLLRENIDLLALAREMLDTARQLRREDMEATPAAISFRMAVGRSPNTQNVVEQLERDVNDEAARRAKELGFDGPVAQLKLPRKK